MEEIICVSSGSDEDSDLEVIGCYTDDKEDAVPFIRAELLPVTPVLIDITDHSFTSSRRRCSRRSSLEIIDLSEDDPPDLRVHKTPASFRKSQKYSADSGCFVGTRVQPLCEENTDVLQTTENHLHQDTNCNSELLSSDKTLDYIRNPYKSKLEVFGNSVADVSQNTKDTELSAVGAENEEYKWEDNALDSPYYCPSEVDDYLLSDSSNKSEDNHHRFTANNSQQTTDNALLLKEDGETENIVKYEDFHTDPDCCSPSWSPEHTSRHSKANSPTSTEILASDTTAHSPDMSILSSPNSSFSLFTSQPSSPILPAHTGSSENPSTRLGDNENALENHNSQYICLAQYRRLGQSIGGTVPQTPHDGTEEEDEHYGPAEPLCRQSLSLVYSTIEENYPEGSLQLLSDFIQPRYYPPPDITSHLLRGIFLDPQSTDVLVVEAFNLLMKTQRYHPVDASTVPWDWELMKSVMKDQDDTRRMRTEVQVMFLQYVLRVLEDDFQFKVSSQCLQNSLAKKVLSCGLETFGQVRDVIMWMMNAAKESVNLSKEYPKKEDDYLKMVLSLQSMLTLALEVDKDPTYNSEKITIALFNSLNRLCECRQMRLLILNSLENKLLKCKLLKLLLDGACSTKTGLPLSQSLLLHYLKSCTLTSDPSDGAENWRKWDELLQLLWMLLLSYDDVVTGHLLSPITKRFPSIRTPNWSYNDQVRPSALKEAANAFLSRAAEDIDQSLPMEMQDSLSQLQEHITDMSSIIKSH